MKSQRPFYMLRSERDVDVNDNSDKIIMRYLGFELLLHNSLVANKSKRIY